MAKTLKECGFNSGFFGSSDIAMTNGLARSQEEDIKIGIAAPIVMGTKDEIVNNWDIFLNKWRNSIDKYKDNPALSCWYFFDEPIYEMLEKLKEDYRGICAQNPSRMFIIVWVGWTGGVQFCGTEVLDKPYFKYLELIQQNVAPGVWLYDLYPIGGLEENELTVNYKQFYEDFEAAHKMTLFSQRPFWAYCQSMSYEVLSSNECRPAPTVPFLRYEAFSALAYGAQGIVYWTYALSNNSDKNTFYAALVDLKGEKMEPYWSYAKKVNEEIRNLTDVFLGATLMRVAHVGDGDDYAATKIAEVTTPLGKFWPILGFKASGIGAMVSHLSNNGTDYLVIANHSPLQKQVINMTLSKGYTYNRLSVDDTASSYREISTSANDKVIDCTLEPGGYLVYSYTRKEPVANYPAYGTFPIMALGCLPDTTHITEEMINRLIDCGFNSGEFHNSQTAIANAFKAIGGKEFYLFPSNPSLYKDETSCREFVGQFSAQPRLGGWRACYDWQYSDLNSAKLKNMYSLLESLAIGKVVTNFYYLGRDATYIGQDGIESLLEKIQENYDPQVWNYTYGGFETDGHSISFHEKDFYENLRQLAAISLQSGHPFWGYCRVHSLHNKNLATPLPTEGMIRLQVFAALAFGASGMVYGTYRLPTNTNFQTYTMAPVDQSGNPSPVWYYIRRINRELAAGLNYFKDFVCVGSKLLSADDFEANANLPLILGLARSVRFGSKGVLVCSTRNGSTNRIAVVNLDYEFSQTVTVSFSQYVRLLTATTVDNQESTQAAASHTISLLPGGVAVFS